MRVEEGGRGGGERGWLVNFIRAIPDRRLAIERNKTRRNNEDYSASAPEAFDGGTTYIVRRVLLLGGVERVVRLKGRRGIFEKKKRRGDFVTKLISRFIFKRWIEK